MIRECCEVPEHSADTALTLPRAKGSWPGALREMGWKKHFREAQVASASPPRCDGP